MPWFELTTLNTKGKQSNGYETWSAFESIGHKHTEWGNWQVPIELCELYELTPETEVFQRHSNHGKSQKQNIGFDF